MAGWEIVEIVRLGDAHHYRVRRRGQHTCLGAPLPPTDVRPSSELVAVSRAS